MPAPDRAMSQNSAHGEPAPSRWLGRSTIFVAIIAALTGTGVPLAFARGASSTHQPTHSAQAAATYQPPTILRDRSGDPVLTIHVNGQLKVSAGGQ